MDQNTVAQAIIAGPINDTGQLALALVINTLSGPDVWTVHTRTDLAKATRTKCRKASLKRINAMIASGYLEERKKPVTGLRLTAKALNWAGVSDLKIGVSHLTDGVSDPAPTMGSETSPMGPETSPVGYLTHTPSPSAYLPKRCKDKKEVEEKDPRSSSPTNGPVLAASNPPPIAPRLDPLVAQLPAVVEQTEGRPDEPLPAKPRRKQPENPVTRIPEGWEPSSEHLDNLEAKHGIPRAFAEALVWEFVDYWTDRGGRKHSWKSAFTHHAKSQWKREQEHAQRAKADQDYRDRSGKPISEADYLSRENARRVLADMESGLLDNFDLDTPV